MKHWRRRFQKDISFLFLLGHRSLSLPSFDSASPESFFDRLRHSKSQSYPPLPFHFFSLSLSLSLSLIRPRGLLNYVLARKSAEGEEKEYEEEDDRIDYLVNTYVLTI